MNFPDKLLHKLNKRKEENSYRKLTDEHDLIDFSSNDYLGVCKDFQSISFDTYSMGATGSRLLTGNFEIHQKVEDFIAKTHGFDSALIFNSGYSANLGFFSTIPQKGDLVFYDEEIHASIRDGLQLSNAKSLKFKHNDFVDLENKMNSLTGYEEIYVVVESVYSMSGDSPSPKEIKSFMTRYPQIKLIIDEAHSVGVFGENGKGWVHQMNLNSYVFALLVAYGKAFGFHGAAILGSKDLKNFLVNFCRSFIYTTGISPKDVSVIGELYQEILLVDKKRDKLKSLVTYFRQKAIKESIEILDSISSIQGVRVNGNDEAKSLSFFLKENGLNVKPILSPTVKEGSERLRVSIHTFNTEKEIDLLIHKIKAYYG